MSDAICTTPGCAAGRASVNQMRNTFAELSGTTGFHTNQWEPTVKAIEKSFFDNVGFWSDWIPFNPACCTAKAIGEQADALTQQMLASVGAAVPLPGPGSAPPAFELGGFQDLITLALVAMVVINVLPMVRRSS